MVPPRQFWGPPQRRQAVPPTRGRPGAAVISIPSPRARRGSEKPRQEICAPLKWACFAINFLIFLASVACLALGIYLCLKDPRPINEVADVLLNPAFLFTIVGLAAGIVSLFGLFGALRDNVCLLKLFALCVFLGYVALVVLTFAVFVLFYADLSENFSVQSILQYSIKKYHTNRNVADTVDYVQEQLECCGSASFRDWQLSEQFNCTPSNPYPERCGVPFSCCRRAVVSEAGGNMNPLAPAIRSLQCWQNAQRKPEQELDNDIYTIGCMQPLRSLFDKHAIHFGMVVVVIIVPVSLGVCLSQCLARQIDHQHYLLQREQRRLDRRERRERRYMDHLNVAAPQRRRSSVALVDASLQSQALPAAPKRPPPNIPPPPTPKGQESLEDAVALATAIAASKREFEREQKRRQRREQAAIDSGMNSPGTSAAGGRGGAIKDSSSPKSSPKAAVSPREKDRGKLVGAGKSEKKDQQKVPNGKDNKKSPNKESQTQQQQKTTAKNDTSRLPPAAVVVHPRVLPSAPPAPVHYILQQSYFS